MKLLLDENLPVKLKYRFLDKGIEALTVTDMKWNDKTNGELLQLMIEQGFNHLISIDSNISFQQNFSRYPIPVIVIIAPSNSYTVIMGIFNEIVFVTENSIAGPNVVSHPLKKP